MPQSLNQIEIERLNRVIDTRRKIRRGDFLFRHGERFTNLYAIRTGFFKTSVKRKNGLCQVTGFQMAAEVLGFDGIAGGQHVCTVVALEDAEVCVMPFASIEELCREIDTLQRYVHKIMSLEIVRENNLMLLLGNMRAEERIAAFLLNLSQRLHARGFSEFELILRMSREEIASYLGLQVETVSRTLSKLVENGAVEIKNRHVRILNMLRLKGITNLFE